VLAGFQDWIRERIPLANQVGKPSDQDFVTVARAKRSGLGA
jgi:hypothetical protein